MINRLAIIFLIVSFVLPAGVKAALPPISVSPAVIDVKAKPRDILQESLVLTNTDNFKQTVYIFVNNISAETGKEEFLDPSRADKTTSLANWIEISRAAIILSPAEKREIDFLIRVNLSATPGLYHANIFFAPGTTRAEAEAKLVAAPSIAVNMEILDDAKEGLELNKFSTDRSFFIGFPVSFLYSLKNIGNRSLVPFGEIIIYDRRGREVAAFALGQAGATIEPSQTVQQSIIWNEGKGFGLYKAILNLNYGNQSQRALYDVIFFWVIPGRKILAILAGGLILIVFLVIFIHKKYEKRRA